MRSSAPLEYFRTRRSQAVRLPITGGAGTQPVAATEPEAPVSVPAKAAVETQGHRI